MDNLILKLIEVKYEKSSSARNQNYEQAARLRDTEKVLEKELYHIITETEKDKNYTTKIYQETIDNYVFEKYGFDYPNIWINLDEAKAFIRDLKLKIMGI
jgi:ATP-dependent Clp protease ATP-binding subunit ClpC